MSLDIKNLLDGLLPAEKIHSFSLVGTSKAELQQWVANLPMLNIGNTAKQIFTTLQELAIIDVADATRFELMETLRPATESIIESLSKHYINQNLMHDQRAERIAKLAQHLRAYVALIYHGIALRTAQHYQKQTFGLLDIVKKKNLTNLIAKASHRGLTEFYALLLKIKTLYISDYPSMWLRIHELFDLAHSMGLGGFTLEDKQLNYGKKLSIEQMYLRAILLSACQTSKLRQAEIKKIGQLSELWLGMIRISATPSTSDLLYVNTTCDGAPQYAKTAQAKAADTFFINVDALLSHFEHLQSETSGLLHADEGALLSSSLKHHLLQILQSPKERVAERLPQDGTLAVTLGFIGSHYQLAGQRPFTELIQVPDLTSSIDFADIYMNLNQNYELMHDESQANAMDNYFAAHTSHMVNISETGYCARWAGTPPRTLRTGELVSIKQGDESGWRVGLVRWVQQHLNTDPEFGVEILSEHGVACGARVMLADGNVTDYMRTLLLPHEDAQHKSTLITPALVFKAGHKVLIRLGDDEVQVRLERELLVTQSFSQFEFVVEKTISSGQQTFHNLMG